MIRLHELASQAEGKKLLEVTVPQLKHTLWIARSEQEVGPLVEEGIRRGRIWTVAELRAVADAPGMSWEDFVTIARARIAFDATVTDVRPDDPPAVPSAPQDRPPEDPAQPSLDFEVPPPEYDR